MAQSKRPLVSLGDEGSNESIKRVKLEPGAGRVMSVDIDELEHEYQSDEELASNAEGAEDLDDEDANLRAYEKSKEKHGRPRHSDSPTAGVIKSVRVVNFMCHHHYSMKFAPTLNFIVGHNGSGKSAILTAIAVALGAKASTTGRGQGVKDLIRRGATKSTITLIIANQGREAFEPEKYPSEIIIERIIDKNGSSFKFRAAEDGKILETKREELTRICQHFNIDVDSPLCMLTQDAAKSFLATSDPNKLYAFFLRGTNLATLAEQYSVIEMTRAKIDRQLVASKETIPDLETKVARHKRDLDAARKAGELKTEKANVEKRLAWAYVRQKELEVEEEEDKLDQKKQKVTLLEEKVAEIEEQRQPITAQIQKLEAELMTSAQGQRGLRDQVRKANSELDGKKRELRSTETAIQEAETELTLVKREMAEVEARIAARDRESGLGASAEEVEARDRQQKAQKMLSNMRRSQPAAEREVEAAKSKLDEAESQRRALEGQRDDRGRQLEQTRASLTSLERQSTNKLAAYGTNINLVLDAINRTNWHHSKPLGPLGQYVQLEDMRHKDVVESLIGNTLCSFAVRDGRDKALLLKILTDCYKRGYRSSGGDKSIPPIIQHAGDLFDFSRGDLSSISTTVLSKLKVTNPEVLRILVNTHKVERMLLAPNKQAALTEINRVIDLGQGDATCISDDLANQTGRGKSFRNFTPMQSWRGGSLFVRSYDEEIAAARLGVQNHEREYRAILERNKEFGQTVKAAEGTLAQKKRALAAICDGIPKVVLKITELGDRIESLQPADGDALQSAKTELETSVKDHERELGHLQEQREKNKEEVAAAHEKYDDLRQQEAAFAPDKDQKTEAVTKLMQRQLKLTSDEKHYKGSKERALEDVDRSKTKITQAGQELQEWTDKAASFCERQDSTESVEQLNMRRVALETQIKEANRRNNIDIDDVTSKYNEVVDQLNKQKTDIAKFSQLSKVMKRAIDQRQVKWQELRHHIAVRARTAFTHNVNKRGLEGRLLFNHDNEQLTIRVDTGLRQTQEGGMSQSRFKAPVALSGGERSFATVSFLLALWDTAPAAIRCLDEWDVFLDMVNRQLAAKMLLEGATASEGKQHIFITPQNMGGVNLIGPDKKIIKMDDPRAMRGQATLTAR